MSVLTGPEIIRQVVMGRIHIDPFIESNVGPNSYDLRWGNTYRLYTNTLLDVRGVNPTVEYPFPEEGMILTPGELYIMATIEEAGSDYYRPCIETRSSMARLGITTHLSAGYGDHGFKRQWTLEVTAIKPVKVYPGDRVCQIEFVTMDGKPMPYDQRKSSKYATQTGPTAAIGEENS